MTATTRKTASRAENDLSTDARNALVLSCKNLCHGLARRAVPFDDNRARYEQKVEEMSGEALLACVEAARHFQPVGDAKFSTVAQSYITKRLKGVAAAERLAATAMNGAAWEVISGHDLDDEVGETVVLIIHPDDAALLATLPLGTRDAVRLVVFGRVPPDRAATQLGVPTKDLKLMLRNAAPLLVKAKAKAMNPNLLALLDEEGE